MVYQTLGYPFRLAIWPLYIGVQNLILFVKNILFLWLGSGVGVRWLDKVGIRMNSALIGVGVGLGLVLSLAILLGCFLS